MQSYQHFLIFYSNFFLSHKKIEEAKKLVEDEIAISQTQETQHYSLERVNQIRRAQNIVTSAVHPDTGEYIPRVMRLCSYATMSIPTLFGFLLSKPTFF